MVAVTRGERMPIRRATKATTRGTARNMVEALFIALVLHALLSYGLSDDPEETSAESRSALTMLGPESSTRTATITPTQHLSRIPSSMPTASAVMTHSLPWSQESIPVEIHQGTVSSTSSMSYSLSPSLSPETEADNMYIRAECCRTPMIQRCAVEFCGCMASAILPQGNFSRLPGVSFDGCVVAAKRNCYHTQYCVRERVSCIWNASLEYEMGVSREMTSSNLSTNCLGLNETEGDLCLGVKQIYNNFTQLAPDVSYYDSHFYNECVDYVMRIFGRMTGVFCLPKIVHMYACGPSLFPVAPPRPSNYTPALKGSRRLVIAIKAFIVGNFSAIFNATVSAENKRDSSKWLSKLNSSMYNCFFNAIGVAGEFSMEYGDECITVEYDVGVRDADPSVGDIVTANALRLMLHNVSWMDEAQAVVDAANCTSSLTVPVVVYDVRFEADGGDHSPELCNKSCVVGLTFAAVLAFVVFCVSTLLCLKRPRRTYSMFDISYDAEEEMECICDRQSMKRSVPSSTLHPRHPRVFPPVSDK